MRLTDSQERSKHQVQLFSEWPGQETHRMHHAQRDLDAEVRRGRAQCEACEDSGGRKLLT